MLIFLYCEKPSFNSSPKMHQKMLWAGGQVSFPLKAYTRLWIQCYLGKAKRMQIDFTWL